MPQKESDSYMSVFLILLLVLVVITGVPYVVKNMDHINANITSNVWYKVVVQFIAGMLQTLIKGIFVGLGTALDMVVDWSTTSMTDKIYSIAVLLVMLGVVFVPTNFVYGLFNDDGGMIIPILVSIVITFAIIAPLSMVILVNHGIDSINDKTGFNLTQAPEDQVFEIKEYPIINLIQNETINKTG